MRIKATRLPELQKLKDSSYDSLKRQFTNNSLSQTYRTDGKRLDQYIQVNFIKDFVYKISPEKFSRLPLVKEEQNLKDYLFEVKNDEDRLLGVNNQLKDKFFRLFDRTNKKKNHQNLKQLTSKTSRNNSNKKGEYFQMFDPIEHLAEMKQTKRVKLAKRIEKQEMLTFLNKVQSVKYIDQDPETQRFPSPSSGMNNRKSDTKQINQRMIDTRKLSKTQRQISNSLQKLLQKSVRYQSPQKDGLRKLKKYKSRNQLNKANQKIIKTQKDHIFKLIQIQQKKPPQKTHLLSAKSVDQIPAKQKYNLDFVSYMRTKTKQQLDKMIYQKLIKKPQKDLQKFQQFILKEVKFENEENKHKIERFFMKMRQQFRRVQKYGKQGSKFDWRSQSMHLQQIKKQQQQKIKISKLVQSGSQQFELFPLELYNKSVSVKQKRRLSRKALLQKIKQKSKQRTSINMSEVQEKQIDENEENEENKQEFLVQQ